MDNIERQAITRQIIQSSMNVHEKLLKDNALQNIIAEVAACIAQTYRKGGKVLICGNGGSAADAQHIAAELSGKFYLLREPLDAEALHVNTSYLTAVANDYSYDEIFSRLVKAKGKKGDVLMGISTSGNSANVVSALRQAKDMGMVVIGMSGSVEGKMDTQCHYLIKVPSEDTPRIQELHILTGHIICQLVESELFAL